MNKRPYNHSTLFLLTSLLVVVLLIFVFLPNAKPATAEAVPTANGTCARFSLHQGRNAATGAGVAGRYEMREVTTTRLLASWEASSKATVSDWLIDLPQVSDGGSWVEVFFLAGGEDTAVPLEILNPAPNTAYGWVANGQCHAIELQFPTDWTTNSNNSSETNNSGGVGGGNHTENVTENEQENSNTESVEEATGFQQDWFPNSGSLRPITDVQATNVNAPLAVGQMGAWQDGSRVAYGFTLTNTSADHYITNVEYLVSFTGADGNLVNEHTVQSVRDFFPLEAVNLGESYFADSETAYDEVEISFISAEAIPISDTPLALEWRPSRDVPFSETGIWLLQEQGEDTNEIQFFFEVINPNATFVGTNTTFSIKIVDDAGNILGQGQGDIGNLQPLQSWELKGSIFVESPELISDAEIVIEPEQFTPIDLTTIPTRLIQEDQISFSSQNVNITFPGQIEFTHHLAEMITDEGSGFIVAIAYDSEGVPIGGGAHELFGAQLVSTAQSIFMPIRASESPATVELYLTYDFIDDRPPRGGGGGHPGRDVG